jgi:hypothetical protein
MKIYMAGEGHVIEKNSFYTIFNKTKFLLFVIIL